MTSPQDTTQFVDRDGGRIAYDVSGDGPLVVLSHGIADTRRSYRFLAPLLVAAGYRVAAVDLRGHGESTTGWASHTRTDTAGDLIAVIEELGGPAVVVGQSFAGGSATIAAATRPDLVSAIVEIAPATRAAAFSMSGLLRNRRHRTATLRLGRWLVTGSARAWSRYLDVAYPGRRPADWDAWLADLVDGLKQPGRMAAAQAMAKASAKDAGAALPEVRRPTLIVMGSEDPDWPDPAAEAAEIVRLLPDGLGRAAIIDGAGHYPHAQYPDRVAAAMTEFLAAHIHA